MKKYLSLLLALALMLTLPFIATNAKASDDPSVKVYVSVNTSSTNFKYTGVPTTTIIPGKHRILKWSVSTTNSGSGTTIAALYDADTQAEATTSTLFGERACANTTSAEYTFTYPKDITDGVYIEQGPYTVVTIEYERSRP
jgi:hypothetical protein